MEGCCQWKPWLSTIESGSFFKGHGFAEQYADLEEASRNEIERRHKETEATSQFFVDMRARRFPTDLASLLKLGKETFVHFRYAFENNSAAKGTVWGLDACMQIVRDVILERRPEWKPQGYRPFQ